DLVGEIHRPEAAFGQLVEDAVLSEDRLAFPQRQLGSLALLLRGDVGRFLVHHAGILPRPFARVAALTAPKFRVLLLYQTGGSGHIATASAIREGLERRPVELTIRNFTDALPGPWKKAADLYNRRMKKTADYFDQIVEYMDADFFGKDRSLKSLI